MSKLQSWLSFSHFLQPHSWKFSMTAANHTRNYFSVPLWISGNISYCLNEGDILDSSNCAGGLVGDFSNSNLTISNSGNRGDVNSKGTYIGSLAGSSLTSSGMYATIILTNCFNTGSVTGNRGLAGPTGTFKMSNCCNNAGGGLGATATRVAANYWLYDAATGRGTETFENSKDYTTAEWFSNDADGAYLLGDKTKDLVTLLNSYVETNGGTFWKYEVIDGYACPVLDL